MEPNSLPIRRNTFSLVSRVSMSGIRHSSYFLFFKHCLLNVYNYFIGMLEDKFEVDMEAAKRSDFL